MTSTERTIPRATPRETRCNGKMSGNIIKPTLEETITYSQPRLARRRSFLKRAVTAITLPLAALAMACDGGPTKPTPPITPTPTPTYVKTVNVISAPSNNEYDDLEVVVDGGRAMITKADLQSAGVPNPKYAFCAEAPVDVPGEDGSMDRFIGEIKGVMYNDVMQCEFDPNGEGLIVVGENNTHLDCAFNNYDMGQQAATGTPSGGGQTIRVRKIRDGEVVENVNYPGYSFTGANGPDEHITEWLRKMNDLYQIGEEGENGVRVLKFVWKKNNDSAEMRAGYLVLTSGSGRHFAKDMFAVNEKLDNDISIQSRGISEGAEATIPGRNNPQCNGTYLIQSGEYTDFAYNVGVISAGYGSYEQSH